MMQAAESRKRSHAASLCGTTPSQPTRGRILFESQVRAIFMVIGQIFRKQPFQMSLVEHDHVIEQFAAAASHQRSATPFCQGLRYAVRKGSLPSFRTVDTTSQPNLESGSNSRNLGVDV